METSFDQAIETPVLNNPKSKMMKIAEYLLFTLVFLLPFFFIPFASFPFQFTKIALFGLVTLVVFSLWIIDSMTKGSIKIPWGLTTYSSGAVLLFVLLSAIVSPNLMKSVLGLGFETETLLTIFTLFALMFTSYAVLNERSKILKVYNLLSISALVIFLFQALRITFGVNFLSFGIFTTSTTNLLGKWNDLGVFFGLMAILSVLKLIYIRSGSKKFSYLMLAISLIAIIVINSILVWTIIGVFSLLMFVFEIAFTRKEEDLVVSNSKPSKLPLLLVVISIVFIFARASVGGFVLNSLGINQLEVRPSWQSTMSIAGEALKEDPAFGVGPNQFSSVWNKHKPEEVNLTPFWNVDFNFGVGFIPTTLSTEGVLGFMSWLLLVVSLVLLGLRSIVAASKDSGLNKFLTLSLLITSLYLWTHMIFYLPSTVMIILTFLFTGMFLSIASHIKISPEKEFTFTKDSVYGFAAISALAVLLIVNLAAIYGLSSRYLSGIYFQKSLIEFNLKGNIEAGEKFADTALFFAKTDRNYRLMSSIDILKVNNLVSETGNVATDETRALFQNLLGSAIRNAQLATQIDESNYQNWLSLGSVYESIIPLGINGSYESAINTYNRAIAENPSNPQIDLILARTALANGDNQKAKEYIASSLEKKSNYTAAIFLLAQIEIAEGNINGAINSIESAVLIDPNDSGLFFQLGFLRFNQGNYERAIQALERSVVLNPLYSNAKYFLGLAYYNSDRSDEAIIQFGDLVVSNPDNEEVKIILQNMKDGLENPLSGLDNVEPSSREDLPVNEDVQ